MPAAGMMSKSNSDVAEAGSSGLAPATSPRRGLIAESLRLFNTARHFRARQIIGRAFSGVRSRVSRTRAVDRYAPALPDAAVCADAVLGEIAARKFAERRTQPDAAARAACILSGEWAFHGRSLQL